MKFVIDKEFEDIVLEDIENLVKNKVAENICLDYKSQNYGVSNGNKRELLKDITAFANSSGGDLIIGISDDKYNQANNLCGIATTNIAAEVNRIEQIIFNGTEPKLNTIKIKYFKLNNDRFIIFIRVQASPLFPHMISFQRTNKFYIRKSDKNILLDAYELRNIFLKSENIIENIKNENKKIVLKVFSNETTIPINNNLPKIIINFVPYSSIDNNKNILNFNKNKIKLDFPEQKINFDGILGYKTNQKGIESYCQLYRNGIIEFVSTSDKIFSKVENPYQTGEINVISGEKNGYEFYIIKKCIYFYNFLKNLGIELPIYLFITLVDVKGYRIMYKNTSNNTVKITDAIDRDLLELPEIELKSYNLDIKKITSTVINMIWNACGLEKSINFDEKNEWVGEKIID